MSKADVIEIEGTVVEKLPNTMFQAVSYTHLTLPTKLEV